jgi:ABC-2 type transport system ATP-binding protein
MTAGTALLAAGGISKSYGKRRILHDVSLEVRAGSIVGICGENGAGKSTLLRILMGLLPPDTGSVSCGVRTGYCPQQVQLFDQLTVDEHFRYYACAYATRANGRSLRSATELKRRTDELKDMLQLFPANGQQVRALSGGTQQKLNLALALLHDPQLLILDEPYAGFDWETYLRFWDIAGELRAAGKGILIVSHLVFDHKQFNTLCTLAHGALTCSSTEY